MIECKSCGAYLKFDIPSQKLKCDYCKTEMTVEEAEEIRSAEASATGDLDGITVNSFQCTQCGGTIFGDEHDMTGFCSYCGSSVELAGRLTKIERPQSIIPFKKTKEDCKEIFLKTVRKDPYLPKGYRDKEHIDSFRGIYMPYYLYNVDFDGPVATIADGKTVRQGDYEVTDQFKITCNVNGTFSGFEHDSSSAFNDGISEALGPYPADQRLPFKAGYISGFYADSSDEKDTKYSKKAGAAAKEKLAGQLSTAVRNQNRAVHIKKSDHLNGSLKNIRSEKAMYPVWFMCYRNDDRVAYAAVNGQTGKIAADLPIDMKKFIIFTLLLIIPLFIILNLMAVIKPSTMLLIYTVMGVIGNLLLYMQSGQIIEHDGYEFPRRIKTKKDIAKEEFEASLSENDKQNVHFAKFILLFAAVIIGAFIISLLASGGTPLLLLAFSMIIIGMTISNNKVMKQHGLKLKGIPFGMLIAAANLITAAMLWVKPVFDGWYYSVCIFILAMMFALVLSMVSNHNFIATRKPIQFNKKGGDDRA